MFKFKSNNFLNILFQKIEREIFDYVTLLNCMLYDDGFEAQNSTEMKVQGIPF